MSGELELEGGERHVQRNMQVVVLPQETRAEGDGTVLEWVSASQRELVAIQEKLEQYESRLSAGETLSDTELGRYGDQQHRFEVLGGYEQESRVQSTLTGLGFFPLPRRGLLLPTLDMAPGSDSLLFFL